MAYTSHELITSSWHGCLRPCSPEVVVFQIPCPLGHTLEITSEHLGQRLMCPLCQAVVHASPPRLGEQPGAKYEVQCAKSHTLRVKRKYLGKKIRCPSCQEWVSIKPGKMLTSNGTPLKVAMPDVFKKQSKPAQNTLASADPKSTPKRTSADSIRSCRIAPPPSIGNQNDTADEMPKAPAVVDENDDHFSYDAPPPSATNVLPTGLHSLSASEMMKVNHAARKISEPATLTLFNCPNGHLLEIESTYEGMQIHCPVCQAIFDMPVVPPNGLVFLAALSVALDG